MNQVGKVLLAALGVLGSASSPATAADAVLDFSINANPNGPWSYGWAAALGGQFNLYANRTVNQVPGLDAWWLGSCGDTPPSVAHNTTGSPVSVSSVTVPPDLLNLHPGCSNQYSIVRWTAPAAGQYQIQGRFQGNDHGNPSFRPYTTTDVHIRLNSSTVLFDNAVIGYGTPSAVPFSLVQQVNAGDTIDFAVGYGTDGDFYDDSTGLAATITSSGPDPLTVCQTSLTTANNQISQLNATISSLQSQVTALTAQNSQLQNQFNQVNTGLNQIQSDFRTAFANPSFTMPGGALLQQYQNLINAILRLNVGRKTGIYENLGGIP